MYNERSQRGVFSVRGLLTTFRKDVLKMAARKSTTGYFVVHDRLRKIARGVCKAIVLGLPDCDKPAREWALIHGANNVLDEKHNLLFSNNAHDYIPLCVKCHRNYDGNIKTAWDRDHDGRAATLCRGERHRAAHKHAYKLTEADALSIHARRADGETGRFIAQSLGVTEGAVSMILSGKRWGHLKADCSIPATKETT
jgi:hypothetical protein